MTPRVRSLLVFLVGGAALVFTADTVVRTPGLLVPRDFLEYWSSGRVNLRAGNPYHPDELLAEQQLADPARTEAVMMWNPPPALAVYMPFGALAPKWAALLWLGLQVVAVFGACDLLWRAFFQCGPLAPRAVQGAAGGSSDGPRATSDPPGQPLAARAGHTPAPDRQCGPLAPRAVRGEAGSSSENPRTASDPPDQPLAERAGHTQTPLRGVATVVALSFVGTWWLIAFGQNTGLLLLGLAGFLHFTKKEKPLAAGACAALTALKPHLLAVFGVLLVADALTRRGRATLAAGSAMIAVALGAALAANPAVIGQFVETARHPAEGAVPLSAWKLPVPAYALRVACAPGHFWVQFLPCALACACALVYRFWSGTAWDWSRTLPLVVAVSVVVTPYGGWIFDLPVLLVPVVWAAARLVSAHRWVLAGTFVAGQVAVTAASFAWIFGLHEFWWVAPAALALCLPAAFVPRRLS